MGVADDAVRVSGRYIVVVDIGGRSVSADYSVIVVFDRYWQMYGGVPEVVAQWRGHIDHDLLAWKAAQIASFYQEALLVIESNTLETEHTDGEHTEYILDTLSDAYSHLYARASSETIRSSAPSRWGFHMNRSTKTLIINHQIQMLRESGYVERDLLALLRTRCLRAQAQRQFRCHGRSPRRYSHYPLYRYLYLLFRAVARPRWPGAPHSSPLVDAS